MFNSLKKYNMISILLSILLIVVGGIFVFNPANSLLTIIKVIAVGLLIFGSVMIIRYLANFKDSAYINYSFDLVIGTISATCGLVLFFNPGIIAGIIPFFLGIGLTMQGAIKLQYAFQLRNDNVKNWTLLLAIALLTLTAGIIIAFNPFLSASVFTSLIGWTMIIEGITNIVESIALIDMFGQIERIMKK